VTATGRHVVVVGSVNLDLVVRTPRHPLPGETVSGDSLQTGPGGKGLNQAVAAARSGATVRMVGAVGDDLGGRAATRLLESDGVDVTSIVVRDDEPTGHALVTVDAHGENAIVVVAGANASVDAHSVESTLTGLTPDDVVLLQNELPADATRAAATAARRAGATVVWNAAPAPSSTSEIPADLDLLVVNEHELAVVAALLDVPAAPDADRGTAVSLALRCAVVVTRGADGSTVVDGTRCESVPAALVDVVDTTAAGDTFIGYLAGRLGRHGVDARALAHAGTAAGLAVTRPGAATSVPSLDDVDRAHGAADASDHRSPTTTRS